MPKTYILDTNVLLHNPEAPLAFQDNNVVIPIAVIEEIDHQKKRQDEIGRNARSLSRLLDGMRSEGQLSRGIPLPGGGALCVEMNHQEIIHFPKGLDPERYDNRILALAHNLKKEAKDPVILVSKDLNLRIKADVLGIPAEDFYGDKVSYVSMYRGIQEAELTREEMDRFFREKVLSWEKKPPPRPHEFLIFRGSENPSQSAMARYRDGAARPLFHEASAPWGIKARNKEQKFALELLMDDEVPVVTLVGAAGTGKTLLAIAAGLEKVIEKKAFQRLLIMRPVIPMGDDLGYLPGSKDEKLRPWMQPIYDNLDYLFRNCSDALSLIEEFRARGQIEMETLTYIRGRSIPNQFILCDEAQNLTPNMIKTLITRVGEGAKIVLTGDPEQIDHPYLDASSNGLTMLVEKLKDERISGHVTLEKGERSEVAETVARLL